VWTGRELLLYGAVHDRKGRPQAAGAAYNPTTRTWRRLPAGPGPVQVMEGGYKAVWTGTEMLGWGLGLDGAYNPATNRWRRLAGPTWSGSIWTGRQVLTWGGGCCGENSAEGAAYTPATDTWQKLPPGPLAGRHTSMAWTGKELVIAGGFTSEDKYFADAAAYNPSTRTWRRLPPMPEPRARATATWDGREVLVVGGSAPPSNVPPYVRLYTDGVAYNPATNRWRHLPAMGDAGRISHTAVWTGRQLLVWGGQTRRADAWVTPRHGVAYDPATNRWSALPTSVLRGRTGHVAVWTGSQMLIWGGSSVTGPNTVFHDGAAYMPTPL
jgi:ribosomal protein L39E